MECGRGEEEGVFCFERRTWEGELWWQSTAWTAWPWHAWVGPACCIGGVGACYGVDDRLCPVVADF